MMRASPERAGRFSCSIAVLVLVAGCDAGSPAGSALSEVAQENAPSPAEITSAPQELPPKAPADEDAWIVATLTQAHASEPRDASWAAQKERDLEGVAARASLPNGTTVSAICRETICLVRVTLASGRPPAVLRGIQFDEAFATSGYVGVDRENPGDVLMFVSREGTMLNEHPYFLAAVQETRRHGG